MGSKDTYSMLFLFFLLVGFAYSSSHISYEALKHHGSKGRSGRSLLQAKQACSVNFETQNYTIITSKCKGPNYNAKICCDAFLEFSCPFNDQINDMNTDCATTMFSYINIYGKYPPGLFSNLCKGDKEGLSCGEEHVQEKSGALKITRSSVLVTIASFLLLLFNVF